MEFDEQSRAKKHGCFFGICLIIGGILSTTLWTTYDNDHLIKPQFFESWSLTNNKNSKFSVALNTIAGIGNNIEDHVTTNLSEIRSANIIASNDSNTIDRNYHHDIDSDSNTITNTLALAPRMLINIGIRSSGTSELTDLVHEYLTPQLGLCCVYGEHKCSEYHYWDQLNNCANVLWRPRKQSKDKNKNKNKNKNKHKNTNENENENYESQFFLGGELINNNNNTNQIQTVQFKLYNDSYYHIKSINNNRQMKPFCNPTDYIAGWQNDYINKVHITKKTNTKKNTTMHQLSSTTTTTTKPNANETELLQLLSKDYILFEKSPRYYVYPHISFIFANSVTFERAKIILFLRDPIKAFLSGFYDAITKEAQEKTRNNTKNIQFLNRFVDETMKRQLLNKMIWNHVDYLKIVRNDLLLPYITQDNQFNELQHIRVRKEEESNVIPIPRPSLFETYEKVIDTWKNIFYYQSFNAFAHGMKSQTINNVTHDTHDNSHKLFVVRSCHIMLLLSWFKDFGYFENMQYDNNTHNSKDRNEKYKYLRNRFKIVQAEYYFANEETVFNYLINWVLQLENDNNNNDNVDKFFHIEQREPKHSHKLRPNITQDEIYKISDFYYPCTAHTIHFLQTNQFRDQLVFGPFDPNLWTLAMQPAGKQRITFDFPN